VTGFTNRSLRAQVAGLLATQYTASQMTYDLRRLRRKGLIRRRLRSNTYTLTPDGVRVAIFYTKICGRLLRPPFAVDHPPLTQNSATHSASSMLTSSPRLITPAFGAA
jgi:predicted MarR family transcription regulator